MAEQTFEDDASVRPLDRTVDLSGLTWAGIVSAAAIVLAIVFRFSQLPGYALAKGEADRAYQAFALMKGLNLPNGTEFSTTEPFLLLANTSSLFLFGDTDTSARIMVALLGVILVVAVLSLRPFIGRSAAAGAAILTALAPTVVFASRTMHPAIAVSAALVVGVSCFLRVGRADLNPAARRRWAMFTGIALAVALASGPTSISMLLALAVGGAFAIVFDPARNGAVREAGIAFLRTGGALISFGIGFAATALVLFTRFFSEPSALSGIGTVFADWGRLLTTSGSNTPKQYFILAVLLYEILAVAFAIFAGSRDDAGPGRLGWPFFAGWFAAALLIFSFSSGRTPEHTVFVALPVVVLGGIGLGQMFDELRPFDRLRGRGGTAFLLLFGGVIGLIAFGALLGRTDTAANTTSAWLEALAVGVFVAGGFLAFAFLQIRDDMREGEKRRPILVALTVLLVFLGIYSFRSSVLLNFFQADDGIELAAQETSSTAVRPMVERMMRLSRDVSVTQATIDDTGGFAQLVVSIDERVAEPFLWYFREFPNTSVVPAGTVLQPGVQVAIAPDDAGMAEAGLVPRGYNVTNRVPPEYIAPSMATVLKNVFNPTNWDDSVNYLLYRRLAQPQTYEAVSVGLSADLAQRISPNSGPFNLNDRPGAGTGRGQFTGPRGIAVSPIDGTVYVVDMGGLRIERFDANGKFVGIWGGSEGGNVTLGVGPSGLGPTGITVAPDGLIYVADTWNHRVVAIDQSGNEVRTIGTTGQNVDLADSPDPNLQTGQFYGPREVLVVGNEIFVSDTGNERVQVFGLDGTFLRTFGGWGSEDGKLLEPVGLALGPDGNVYVADSHNGRISVFTTQGAFVRTFPVASWAGFQYIEPYMTIGPDGYLYATSSVSGSVEVIDLNGTLVRSLYDIGGEELQQPVGITMSPDGRLFITDMGKNAVLTYIALPVEAPQPAEPASPEAASSPPAEPAGPEAAASPAA